MTVMAVPLLQGLGRSVLEGVEYKHFEQLLVGDSNLDRMVWRAVLVVPAIRDKGEGKVNTGQGRGQSEHRTRERAR